MTVSSPSAPPPPQPPKKGLSPLAWVGIGCGVLLVLCVIVLGGLGAVGSYFLHKKAGDFEKNPTMAAAKLAVQLNPDLELVSSDDAKNTITVKDKKTGKVVTFSAEDAKNGKFTIKTDEGTTTIDGNAQNGQLKVTDEKGQTSTFSAGGGEPKDLPSWLPLYPGSTVQGTFDTNNAEGRTAAFTVSSTDPVSKLMDFYESQLKGGGLTVEKSTFSSNGQDGGTLAAKSADEKQTASILFGTSEGKSTATVTFEIKK